MTDAEFQRFMDEFDAKRDAWMKENPERAAEMLASILAIAQWARMMEARHGWKTPR